MKFEDIGRLDKHIAVVMHDNIDEIFTKKFNRSSDGAPYHDILEEWSGQILQIISYNTQPRPNDDEMFKAKGYQTWNLYSEYIKEVVTKESYPEYFL